MASGVNKVILVGRLGADPKVRYTSNGGAVAHFNVATIESWLDKSGQRQERTEWHRIVVWGKLAELCGQYLNKGRQAYIEGRLQTREWTDKEGNKRYTTEIVAQNIQFLGGSGSGEKPAYSTSSSTSEATGIAAPEFEPPQGTDTSQANTDDEVPF